MAKMANTERKKTDEGQRREPQAIYGIRMSRPYLTWLGKLAERERCGKADVIDRALAAYASTIEFKAPPKR